MGLFDKKAKEKPDFSDVHSGSSTMAPKKQPQESAGGMYTVQKGDTLSDIARREYGDATKWRQIFEANRDQIDDPDLIRTGQRLTIPSRSEQGGFK